MNEHEKNSISPLYESTPFPEELPYPPLLSRKPLWLSGLVYGCWYAMAKYLG